MVNFVVGQRVRFRYNGGHFPGSIRVVELTEVGASYVEGYDLSQTGNPYRRFLRSKMENVVEDNRVSV